MPAGLVLALPVAGASPLDRLAGLPLLLRTVLTLQKLGVSPIELGATDELAAVVRADPRVRVELRVRSVESARQAVAESSLAPPFVVAAHHAVAAPALYSALVAQPGEAGSPVLAAEGELPFLATERAIELARASDADLAELTAGWRRDGTARVLEPVGWLADARTREGRQRAVYELFEACRKPVDGIVSRHLNRHVSIFVSKLLVDTAVSPNAVSLVCFGLGVAAAALVAQPSWAAMVAGASLLQVNSILDGVDGELARVRFQGSKLGEWLDTVSDDVSNALFYAGTAWASRLLPEPAPTLAPFGFGAVILALVTMAFYYTELVRLGRGDAYVLDTGAAEPRTGAWAAINTAVRYVLKKDFFVFSFVIAALLGVLPWVLPVAFFGTVATAITGARITLRRWTKRRG